MPEFPVVLNILYDAQGDGGVVVSYVIFFPFALLTDHLVDCEFTTITVLITQLKIVYVGIIYVKLVSLEI